MFRAVSVSPLAMARSALATVILESEDTNPNDKAKPVANIVKLFWHNIRPSRHEQYADNHAKKFYEFGRSQAVIDGILKVLWSK